MAARKSINLLPGVFQTDANEKFLSATVDQLISDPALKNLYGYIGRKFAPTFKKVDSYIIEDNTERQNYQLEPSTLINDNQGNTTFFANYLDFLNKINYYGGHINDHSRLFTSEYYSFDPKISFDKFVNFGQYYWLPNGPTSVDVNTSGVDLVKTYIVARDDTTNKYSFTVGEAQNNTIVLARGGTYTFTTNQDSEFWIQSELGVDGLVNATPTLSTRNVFGVENNGSLVGDVVFHVPQKDAQDIFPAMPTVYNVDYATPTKFSDFQNQYLSDFLLKFPQYAGIVGQLDGKTIIFQGQNQGVNLGEDVWTVGNVAEKQAVSGTIGTSTITLDSVTNITANLTIAGTGIPNGTIVKSVDSANSAITLCTAANVHVSVSLTADASGTYSFNTDKLITYTAGSIIPDALRFGVWKVQLISIDADTLINLYWVQSVSQNEKVYVRYGVKYANTEWYKEFDGFFHQIPLLTAQSNTLYIQDGTNPYIYTTIKIVDYNNFTIDVENDILGKPNYISPNGVAFTSGLKINFGSDVSPDTYQNNTYYVENVGDSIRLVDINLLVTPEIYNDELNTNYPIKRITLTENTITDIPAGTMITIGDVTIETNTTILSGSNNLTTLSNFTTITKGQSVSGLGIVSGTEVYDSFNDTVNPDYITIKRDSLDLNAWARNNRWFHVDIIKASASYNKEKLIFDQKLRAQRPIIQFEGDLQLFNTGRIGKRPIDILDTDINDPFGILEGQALNNGAVTYDNSVIPAKVYYDGVYVGTEDIISFISDSTFGVTLFDGMRVIFAAAIDASIKNKVYAINLVQYQVDTNGLPVGPYHIKLTETDDSEALIYDNVVVKLGKYKGSAWWFDNVNWQQSQQKTSLQQDPLFDVYSYDAITRTNGTSLSDTSYLPRSTFTGTKIFGYKRNDSGTDDTVLGFPLSYRSFTSQGDIQFANYFNTDTFESIIDQQIINKKINTGFLQSIVDRYTTVTQNTWKTVVEPSKQYQILTYTYDGTSNVFQLDITPYPTGSIPNVKVFWYTSQGQNRLSSTQWSIDPDNRITINTTLTIGDIISIVVFSYEISSIGYYEVPNNLDLNAQNVDIDTLTLGQIRNHLVELSRNSTQLQGEVLGPNNLRDIEIKSQGGTILQHSSPVPFAELFLLDEQVNFIESIGYAQREYTKFKNKFLELSANLPGIDPTDPVASVDLIITEINKNKNTSFPWFYSDMVPYGTLKNVIEYTVYDPLVTSYEITNIFSSYTLSNQSVIVYLNGEQKILLLDYVFELDRPAVTFNSEIITLNVGDQITIVEYQDTDGCYIPETPTKIGAYPRYIPEIVLDDTYRNPINVVRGHDGSITPAFNDYRDTILLELEKRIYNNIKLPDVGTYQDIFAVVPGKFRSADYNYTELWSILSKNFLNWVGNNKLDYTSNLTFESNDAFTWNYTNFVDRLDGEYMSGSWRAVYMYFYDTVYPHTRPWEMLGFASMPDWWEGFYGPGPYTGGNKLLWDDLEAGLIRGGPRSQLPDVLGVGHDSHYARPGLSQVIPVDENGFLLSPAQVIAKATISNRAASSWAVGQMGPTEYAWRTSSDFPFAAQQAASLLRPAVYFGQFIDTYRIFYNFDVGQVLTINNTHIKQDEITFNGDISSGSIYRGAGYLNWIADYLRSMGIDPITKITPMLKNYQVNLAYKLGGFSDKKYLQILAEQSSPDSTNASIMLPNENYNILLFKSAPTDKLTYSAVIIEKTTNGYSVRGYDLGNPYFTIIPSIVNNNGYKINVLNESGVIFKDYQPTKITVPYGYEFKTPQQIIDFLISYERYLLAKGFTFNEVDGILGEVRNWKLSVKEFLFWKQQGWKPGSILVLSPITNSLNAITVGSIVDGISDSKYGSKVIDQNFNLVKNTSYNVLRTPSTFNITLSEAASVIAFAELNLVQYEHVLIFDNNTVFNDVIYKPELGNRQYRLKIIGQKTDNWDGSLSAPGFIYNSKIVQSWQSGKDYLKGDLVLYKNQYYVALQNVVASTDFNFVYWKQLSSNELQTGLLNNFSTIAVSSQSFYDSYGQIKDNSQMQYSHGLIGFKPRQYLADLGLTETSQIEFYKGYIKQKGTLNSVTALTKAEFNTLSSSIRYYEEWAVRTGEYGALNSNPYVEIPLDEKAFAVNPATAEFVGIVDSNLGDGISTFNKSQLYKSTDQFIGNIALNRNEHSNYDSDILTAGYVNIDDVSATIFDIADYTTLDGNLENIGAGYTIWCAKDFTGNWNIYRISETDNHAVTFTNNADGTATWTFETPHNLKSNDIFLIKGFDVSVDGFNQVNTVVNLDTIKTNYFGTASNLSGLGMFFKLNSSRFRYMEDARVFNYNGNPLHGWKVGDKIWIDDDAATTTNNGQSYNSPGNTWKVYEKTHPWAYDQTALKSSSEYTTNDGYGTSVKLSYDGLLATIGSPYANTTPYYSLVPVITGRVNTFDKNTESQYVEGLSLTPDGGNATVATTEFGYIVDQAFNRVAVGAPGSFGNLGFVYTYYRALSTTTYSRPQIIWSGNILAIGDRFGSSMAFDQHGTWLYVGAPGNDRVYVYGLNTHITPVKQYVSINDRNIINLAGSGNVANIHVNDIITQANTSSRATVVSVNATNGNIVVTQRTGFITGNTAGNIYVNYINSNLYGNVIYHNSITKTISTFTPNVANNAVSLSITNSNRTFIPDIDYTVTGNVITFSENITEDTYVIEQKPYYTLHATLQGPIGSNFGYAMDSSVDGAQLGVGAPNDNIVGADGNIKVGAGSVYVYDRVIEAFNSTGTQDYTTRGNIDLVHRVTIDGIEVSDAVYSIPGGVGSNLIKFSEVPPLGKVVYVETNQFNLLEKLIGIDNLYGGLSAIQANAAFGTSLTICSNNCAIYVGAPNYSNYPQYNTGAVWKFHNRGRLYGTDTGYTKNPIFLPGNSFRLDNFEIVVSGRMMPTTLANAYPANILTLSSNISANVGQYITQTSTGANITVLANVINSQTITVGSYNNSNVFVYSSGNVISVNGTVTSAYPMASLDSLIKDIDDANLLGISAINEDGYLRLDSNKTIAKNLLRILSGNNINNPTGASNVYSSANMAIFAFMQIIVNPYNAPGEYFGNKVVLAQSAYMLLISSERGTTKFYTTFDNETTVFDDKSTALFDHVIGSGSVYIYELYDDPRNQVEHPGRYAFAQQLNTGDLNLGDKFGSSIDIIGTNIIIGTPGDDTTLTDAGSVYIFTNPTLKRGWNLLRYQHPIVDIESINRLYLYNKNTNTILTNLEFIDPAKGKILGQADQEISYKTEWDPAIYNRGSNGQVTVNSSIYWGDAQAGQVWWNLSQVRFIDYEQASLTYRSINWGRLFPGSVVEVCEWVESTVLPSQYVAAGYDGVPKYTNNSAYVEIIHVDTVTNIVGSLYYFWVTNKTSVKGTDLKRSLPISTIANYISNPKSQGISYAAIIQNNALIVYNVGPYLSASDTILHVDYEIIKNNSIIHSEYELIQEKNSASYIPDKISNKMIDSLSGIDQTGTVVPDPKLSVADRYGIATRPRQSMFINRLRAMVDLTTYVNGVLIKKPVARQFNLDTLLSEESKPNRSLGEYDLAVDTEVNLNYIDTTVLPTGYKILVNNNTAQDNLWVLYELDDAKSWNIVRVQSYKTSLYWSYVDWYATGYGPSDKLDFVVQTLIDAKKLPVAVGEEILVRVNTNPQYSGWILYTVSSTLELVVVGIQNGTIQLNNTLGDFANNSIGLGNQGFDSNRFDQSPNIETRYIINALKNDIFINELEAEYNNLFFVMMNYLFTEQKYVDWIFKTSFTSITHYLRTLVQPSNYIKDNITYYEDYINEVKPYRTKIREYLTNYTSNDVIGGTYTDFDLAPYYDTEIKIFRSPSGEDVAKDEQLWATGYLTSSGKLINQDYPNWYAHRNMYVESIIIENPGAGYASEPIVTILGGGVGVTAATAKATIDGDTGEILNITVTDPGQGYYLTPTIIINGSGSTPATAYAVLKNNQIRTFDASLKFDRITYGTTVKQWYANTAYTANTIVSYDGKAYQAISNITPSNTFVSTDYSVYTANNFSNANDRIMGYYNPGTTMPVIDVISVDLTAANTASNTNTIYVFPKDFMLPGMYVTGNGIDLGYITKIVGNVTISLNSILTTINQVTLSVNVTMNINDTITARYDSMYQLVPGTKFPGSPMTGPGFTVSPLFGLGFDNSVYDPVDFNQNGLALLSNQVYDTIHYSYFDDQLLGTQPQDLITVGGGYVDPTHSYAPEELVPGIVYDTLDMKIYTSNVIVANANVTLGYRMFQTMRNDVSFMRIADDHSTTLAQDLNLIDTEIIVTDASKLSAPNVLENIPGIMFINGERITYWTKNMYSPVAWTANTSYANSTAISHNGINYLTAGNVYANSFNYVNTANISVLAGLNILGQIRRGTQGTAISPVHYKNKVIIDASKSQIIPTTGNLISNINIWYNHGISTITDGAGLNGSTTTAALFLKGATAGNVLIGTVSDELTTEDAINTLTTEDSIRIIEEDQ